ncbi:MAG: hypothetical protein RQM90_12625 [Methanoculleus sp.]
MARIPSLRHDQTLFRDIDVFEPAYVPEQLHHRDAQTRGSSSSSVQPSRVRAR